MFSGDKSYSAANACGLNNPHVSAAADQYGAEIDKPHQTREIFLDLIDDNEENPRGQIDETSPKFLELMASIAAKGMIESIPVTPLPNGRYLQVGGHRRKRAAVRLRWTKVSCTIIENIDRTQQFVIMLSENMHRADLTYCQEARAFAKLLAEGNDTYQIARLLKVKKSHIEARLPLIKLTPEAQNMIDCGDLLLGHGELLARLPLDKQNLYLMRAQQMTVKKFETLVHKLLNPESKPDEEPERGRRRAKSYRVLGDDEQFTRSWALKTLAESEIGEFTAKQLIHSFDDVCQDACIEEKSELACMGCPVPRLVASLIKRAKPVDQK